MGSEYECKENFNLDNNNYKTKKIFQSEMLKKYLQTIK